MAEPTGPTTPATPQRRWQAPCPGCGAAVEFQSAAAPVAVCSYCRSTVVRDGDALKKIGVSAELFQDHTPLQLGTGGTWNGRGFTLIGRLQYGYGAPASAPAARPVIEGSWNEWYALFGDGRGGWLSEDNDQYVFSFDVPRPAYLPVPGALVPGKQLRIGGIQWSVASRVDARLLAAAGELPAPPPLERTYPIVDLRSALDRVATLDYADPGKPGFSVGQPVRLADLALRGAAGLKDAPAAAQGGPGFNCPNCGASVMINLADTKSVSCSACNGLIDLSQGVGAQIRAVKQTKYVDSEIPLGRSGVLSIGELQGKSWQAVGFAIKGGNEDDPDPEERFTWKEYLLYNREEGFAFLIHSVDGWVCYRTLTGAPGAGFADGVTWNGGKYRQVESYTARVKYVEGEYYWRVDKDQRLAVVDYEGTGARSRERLSRETAAGEVVWSWGVVVPASVVGVAFKVPLAALGGDDVKPTSGGDLSPAQVVLFVVIFLFVVLIERCDGCDEDTDPNCRSGSSSSRGFHK